MTELRYPHVLQAVLERPWAIEPSMLALIVDIVRFRAAGGLLAEDEIERRIEAADHGPRSGAGQRRGVAVIPVYGVLNPRANTISRSSGGTTAQDVSADLRAALADDQVDAIVFDVDSPGGAVDGIPELAAEIAAARGQKPMVAVANTLMASAAYWIGAQADEVYASPSARVGSIGIFTAHEDRSKQAEMRGVSTSLVSAGKYKVEANEWAPLSDEARTALQDQVDELYGMFVDAVAQGRGVSADAVRNGYGQGRVLLARQAKAAGLVDRVGTLEQAVRRASQLALKPAPAKAGALRGARASEEDMDEDVGFVAGAIAVHHGTTDNGPWDGPAEEAKIPNDAGAPVLGRMFAYQQDGADPDLKSSYDFIHHFYRGGPGPASTRACTTGRGVLRGARLGPGVHTRWSGSRAGIDAHLAAHLRDAGAETQMQPLSLDDNATASETGPSFAEQLGVVTALTEDLVAELGNRSAIRAADGRGLSPADRARISALRASLEALAAAAEHPSVAAVAMRMRRQLAVAEADFLATKGD